MNFLFGLGFATITAGIAYVAIWFLPTWVWAKLPPALRKRRKVLARSVATIVFIGIAASNFGTYGPRVTLDTQTYVPAPSRLEVESGDAWSDTEDRRGNADELLEAAPVRSDDLTDPKKDDDEHR